ncbi:MAG: hypothetical protein KatS3mg024_2316 [Armatimonadota bacterium]|nr:MAG: hypothetical protein KatS3mg024_2316 [Armatimonadota bacterium]
MKNIIRLLGLAALLMASGAVDAAAIDKDILACGHNVGRLTLSDPDVFDDGASGGVTVQGQFAGNYPPLRNGVEIRWVQLISTSHPLNTNAGANTPYFDPGELDMTGDNDPFYWNTTLKGKDGNNYPQFYYVNYQINAGKGIQFFDQPKRDKSSAPVSWLAELNLVCWETGSKNFSVLWTGTYGFNIAQNGDVSVNGWNELANPVWLTQARLTSYFEGWTMSSACRNCLVPEPVFMQMGALLGMSGLGTLAVRCRARRRSG